LQFPLNIGKIGPRKKKKKKFALQAIIEKKNCVVARNNFHAR
jgi:hypothetical protein